MATESTVRSGAYAQAIEKIRPGTKVKMLAANLLVALVEQGWWDGREAQAVASRYLAELGMPRTDYATLVLGCTHFPLLAPSIETLAGGAVPMIDSARATADVVARFLQSSPVAAPPDAIGDSRFLVTDSAERFSRIGKRFLEGVRFEPGESVFHVDLAPDDPSTR